MSNAMFEKWVIMPKIPAIVVTHIVVCTIQSVMSTTQQQLCVFFLYSEPAVRSIIYIRFALALSPFPWGKL